MEKEFKFNTLVSAKNILEVFVHAVICKGLSQRIQHAMKSLDYTIKMKYANRVCQFHKKLDLHSHSIQLLPCWGYIRREHLNPRRYRPLMVHVLTAKLTKLIIALIRIGEDNILGWKNM